MSAIPQHGPSILLREDRGGVCTLTMNRPLQMNLLTTEMLEALKQAFDSLVDDSSIRVIILAAAGKGFCAGHDLKELRALKELPRIEELFDCCSRMMQTITVLPQPVIARVQGAAAAAGCQLVAETDRLARQLAEKPPVQLAAGKRAFYAQMDLGVAQAYELASGVIAASFAHQEGREGMDAFIEKRDPPGRSRQQP
jgi:enoyl-CoA hydratase/carnithine racemase